MTTIRNAVANIAGRAWSALMSFAFVPLYINLLGLEAYGLIGFFATMIGVFVIVDLGLSVTVMREMARLTEKAPDRAEARIMLRSLETVYWSVSLALATAAVFCAPLIASLWLNASKLPTDQIVDALRLMGVVTLLRLPTALYVGALTGLKRQISLNVITSTGATVTGVGAVLVLLTVRQTIVAFFIWQALAALGQIAVLVYYTWHKLPPINEVVRPGVSRKALRSIAAFSSGIAATTVLSVILAQADKIILSRSLPLDQFGLYALASAIAGLLTTVAGAISGAVFPGLVERVRNGDQDGLAEYYHRSSEMLAVLVIPLGLVAVLFSQEFLTMYIGNTLVADRTYLLLSMLALGNTMLALMVLPVALQHASGWTTLTLYANLIAVTFVVPMLFAAIAVMGAPGAALTWIALTAGYLSLEVIVMHRRLLPFERNRWYLRDLGIPAACSAGAIGAARLLTYWMTSPLLKLVIAGLSVLAAMLLSNLLLSGWRRGLPIGLLLRR